MNPEQIGKNIAKRILVEEFTEKGCNFGTE